MRTFKPFLIMQLIISDKVLVLPVPGGPWIMNKPLLSIAALTAKF